MRRIRRLNRAEKQKQKQERRLLGLEPEETDRVTTSNMMKALGKEAIQDPTRVEQYVKQQMKARMDKHMQTNEERKLTPQERKQKKLQKLRANPTLITHAALFRYCSDPYSYQHTHTHTHTPTLSLSLSLSLALSLARFVSYPTICHIAESRICRMPCGDVKSIILRVSVRLQACC
jgi:hypothetical protein